MTHKSILLAVALLLGGCATPSAPPPSTGHLSTDATPAAAIPAPVTRAPFLPPPEPEPPAETYTVVVNNVPVRELLFALARDAKVNVDIHPGIQGNVTLNAIDQTLPKILDRIAGQVSLRYEIDGADIAILPDEPFLRSYKVDYVNMARDTSSSMSVSTQVFSAGAGQGGGGAGANNTSTDVTSTFKHRIWQTLQANIAAIIAGPGRDVSAEDVILNSEAGYITVRATHAQHELIQTYLDDVQASSHRQVLIEATVVEVALNDTYRTGIDWSSIANAAGFTFTQTLTGGISLLSTTPPARTFLGEYNDADTKLGSVSVAVDLLDQFGDKRILSSPKLMTLNNQTAVLKVVRNEVYFDVESESVVNQNTTTITVDTTAHTVPVGLIMQVTPQIAADDSVILNVRPTLSEVERTVADPNPSLGVPNLVPVIKVREMESVLRVNSGQIAVLGGLMQDNTSLSRRSIPGLADAGGLADLLFSARGQDSNKTELVVFLRPTVIRNASVEDELRAFRPWLPGPAGGVVE